METISSSDDERQTLRDFEAVAALIIRKEMLPKKSSDSYLAVYETLKNYPSQMKQI